jgi:hypothetical protein
MKRPVGRRSAVFLRQRLSSDGFSGFARQGQNGFIGSAIVSSLQHGAMTIVSRFQSDEARRGNPPGLVC